jgi:hypothetical protein
MASPSSAVAAQPVEGVTLEQFAGVNAAVIEGFPLPSVLEGEGLDPGRWPSVSLRWSLRLSADGASGPLSTAFRDTVTFARGWLGRRVGPLEDDLGVWLAFPNAYSSQPDPFDLLRRMGMLPSDVARIQGTWAQRIERDDDLRKKALAIAKKKPSEIPRVTVTQAKRKPFPWTKKSAAAALPEVALVKPKLSSSYIGDAFGLERYASLTAQLGVAPRGGAAAVLAKQALDEAGFAELTARWERRFGVDPTLKQDFTRLVRYYEAKAKAAAAKKGEPSAAEAPVRIEVALPRVEMPPVLAKSALAGTALALDVPRGPALPFVLGEAPEEVALPEAELVEIGEDGEEKPKAAAKPRNKLAGTALALDVPRGQALPFARAVEVKARAQGEIQGGGAGKAEAALTLEQHASMTVEIALAPEKAVEVVQRYGRSLQARPWSATF